MGLSYEEAKRVFMKTILILGAITVFEVVVCLLGKGYIIDGFELPGMLIGGLMIALSLYKAFLIVFEFMHMKYEAPSLMRSVLLPLILLIWGVIAFLYDGGWWNDQREMGNAQVEFVRPADDIHQHEEEVHHGDHHDHHGQDDHGHMDDHQGDSHDEHGEDHEGGHDDHGHDH